MIIILILSAQIKGQNMNDTLSSLCFGANLSQFDSTLVTSFKANKKLKYFNINSIISDSRGEHAKNEFFYKFFFDHAIVNNDSVSGNIYLETKRLNGAIEISTFILTFDSLAENQVVKLFNYFFGLFSNYYDENESMLILGKNNESRFFHFKKINLCALLHYGNKATIGFPENSVSLVLFRSSKILK